MRLIIDTNVLHKVFDPKSSGFINFKPIYKCLYDCKGVLLFGGTTFMNEFKKSEKYLKIVNELRKKNPSKINPLPLHLVDIEETRIYSIESKSRRFDDAHLIACAIVGGCNIICTEDKNKSGKSFLLDRRFYPDNKLIPNIYRDKSHTRLLDKCW